MPEAGSNAGKGFALVMVDISLHSCSFLAWRKTGFEFFDPCGLVLVRIAGLAAALVGGLAAACDAIAGFRMRLPARFARRAGRRRTPDLGLETALSQPLDQLGKP